MPLLVIYLVMDHQCMIVNHLKYGIILFDILKDDWVYLN